METEARKKVEELRTAIALQENKYSLAIQERSDYNTLKSIRDHTKELKNELDELEQLEVSILTEISHGEY